jgi:L-malate glycosyltransferase
MTLVGVPSGDSLSPVAEVIGRRRADLRRKFGSVQRRLAARARMGPARASTRAGTPSSRGPRPLKPPGEAADVEAVTLLSPPSSPLLELPAPADVVGLGRAAAGAANRATLAAGHVPARLELRPDAPERLRICMLAPRVDVGGGARILLEHANRLHDRGHAVLVLSHFPRPDWFELRAEYRHVPVGLGLQDALVPCDVVVCGYWDQVAAARAAGVAPVVHFEQGDFHLFEDIAPARHAYVQANMDLADATTTVSARVGSVLAERYGVSDAGVVHNSVDARVFRADGPRREGAPYLLCVGWDGNEFKGMDDVRTLWEQLRAERPSLELVWVTPRPPLQPMGTVVVAPAQSELAAIYRGAAVYLCASHYESFPLPPLEAMACGAPVVTTANVGVLEYARDAENAVVVPIGDVAAMKAAVGRVLDEPQLGASLRAAGAGTAASFSWDRIIECLETRYRDLARFGLRCGFGSSWDVVLPGIVEAAPVAAARLELALRTATAAEILVPVARPAIEGHEVASWEVVARRAGGHGSLRVHAPHRAFERGALPYQAGIDALDAGRPQEALDVFMRAFAATDVAARKGALGKWVALSLLELYRTGEAFDLLEASLRAFPDNPDYTYLATLVAPMAGRAVDPAHARQNVELIGEGARYEDWFVAPAALLADRSAS